MYVCEYACVPVSEHTHVCMWRSETEVENNLNGSALAIEA